MGEVLNYFKKKGDKPEELCALYDGANEFLKTKLKKLKII